MKGMKVKRLLSISLFSLAMVTMTLWTGFGAGMSEKDVSQGDVVCDQPGIVYHVSGKTDRHTITIKGGTLDSPVEVDLDGVDMDLSSQKKSPLTVESGYAVITSAGIMPGYKTVWSQVRTAGQVCG